MADRGAKPERPGFGAPDPRRGWQTIFPVGTLPIPFHPGLARALPFVLLAASAAPALTGYGWGWAAPLFLWAVLAIPLSLPIVQWVAFAWGMHRLQAILPAWAMILLIGQVASGASHPAMLALPFLFFATHVGLASAGRLFLPHAMRANAILDGEAESRGALPPPLVDAEDRSAVQAETLLAALSLPIGFRRDRDGAYRATARVDAPDAGDRLIDLRRFIDVGTQDARDGTAFVSVPDCAPPNRTLRVRRRRAPLPQRLMLGPVKAIEASVPGERHRYLHGPAAPLLWYPGFVLYLSGYFSGRPSWHAGFVRGPAVTLGEGLQLPELASRAVAPLRDSDVTRPPLVSRAELDAMISGVIARRVEAALTSLDAMLAAPLAKHRCVTSVLQFAPERLAERAPAMIAALEDAAARAPGLPGRAARDVNLGPIQIARTVAMLPDEAFHPIAQRLLAVLAQPVMASGDRMRFGRDGARSLHVPHKARFAGFTLLFHAEDLYPRLAATLGDAARPTIDRLIAQHGPIPPLAEARRLLDA